MTNSGRAMNESPTMEMARSTSFPYLSAATTPMKIENGKISTIANAAR